MHSGIHPEIWTKGTIVPKVIQMMFVIIVALHL